MPGLYIGSSKAAMREIKRTSLYSCGITHLLAINFNVKGKEKWFKVTIFIYFFIYKGV